LRSDNSLEQVLRLPVQKLGQKKTRRGQNRDSRGLIHSPQKLGRTGKGNSGQRQRQSVLRGGGRKKTAGEGSRSKRSLGVVTPLMDNDRKKKEIKSPG